MRLEGPALELLRTSLGLEGVGAQITEFPDGVAHQVTDVVDLIRRGRTFAESEGIFTGTIAHAHTNAEALATLVDPYDVAPLSGFPRPVPPGFDVWLLGANAFEGGAGVISGNTLSMVFILYPATQMGFGAAPAAIRRPVRLFDAAASLSGSVDLFLVSSTGLMPSLSRPIRIPRGAQLGWHSSSLITGELTAHFYMGLFPAALGQDAE